MDANKWLTTITMAGLAGLVILNAGGFATVMKAIGDAGTQYVTTVQGRSTASG